MNKVIKVFETIQITFISVLLAVMLTVIFTATVGRYTTLYVMPWAEELARICMQWLTLIGAGLLAGYGGNFSVDVLVKRFPNKGKVVMYLIQLLIITALCIWVTYYGIMTCRTQIRMNRTSPSMGIPMWIIFAVVPYCGISVGLQNFLYQMKNIKAATGGPAATLNEGEAGPK